jgi:hypothetical protein
MAVSAHPVLSISVGRLSLADQIQPSPPGDLLALGARLLGSKLLSMILDYGSYATPCRLRRAPGTYATRLCSDKPEIAKTRENSFRV